MIVEPKREILLGPLLRAGLRRGWSARDHFIRLAVVPLAVMLTVVFPMHDAMLEADAMLQAMARAGANEIPEGGGPKLLVGLLLGMVYVAALVLFAVNWLRQLTLGKPAAPGLGVVLAGRHLRFFLLIMATVFGSSILSVIVMLMLAGFGMAGLAAAILVTLLLWAAFLVRISPTWIGIALDTRMPIGVAWRRTSGQGFKLLIAVLAVELPLMFAQHLISAIFVGTGLVQFTPMTFTLVTAIIQLVGIAAQLAILVTAFPHFLRETV